MKRIEIKAPAKINIGLDVLSKREDGYHNLNTLFYPILDLFDVLIFEWSERFEFICNASSIPNDESNLVVKAAKLLENFSGKSITAKSELRKNIPSQAGLGGGSSDAAATLISINEMFQLGIKYEKMLELALELGSDVPFFIKAKPAIGTSRGEALKMVNVDIEEPILIVNPGINVSTKEAFSNIKGNEAASDFLALITEGKFSYSLARALIKNDFESISASFLLKNNNVLEEIIIEISEKVNPLTINIEYSEDKKLTSAHQLQGNLSLPTALKIIDHPLFDEYTTTLFRFANIIAKAEKLF